MVTKLRMGGPYVSIDTGKGTDFFLSFIPVYSHEKPPKGVVKLVSLIPIQLLLIFSIIYALLYYQFNPSSLNCLFLCVLGH